MTTMIYLRIVIIPIGSTILLMGARNPGGYESRLPETGSAKR